MALQVDHLRGRVSNVANQLTRTLGELDGAVSRVDGVIFGFRPTPPQPVEKDAPMPDSIEAEVGRIERLAGRLAEILKSAQELEGRLAGSSIGQTEGYANAETQPSRRYA